MSRDRIGIAIAGDRLAGVRESNGRVEEPVMDGRADGEALGAALDRLFSVVVGTSKRLTAGVLVLDERADAGPLFAVSADTPVESVRRQLEEEPTVFFLGVTGSLRAGNVWLFEGEWHGAVVDRALADEVQGAVARAGCRLVGIAAGSDDTAIGSAAVLATTVRSDGPGVVDVEREAREKAMASRRRGGLGLGAVALLVWSLLAPSMALRRDLQREEARLGAARAARDTLAMALRTTPVSAELLLRVAELEAERVLMRAALVALVEALPDSAAIVSLRVERQQGSATLVANDAAAAVGRLARRTEFPGLRVVGAITADNAGGGRLERVNVLWDAAGTATREVP